MRPVYAAVIGGLCLAGSAQAAPDLSAAYAKPLWLQTALMVRTELVEDELDKPEDEQTSGVEQGPSLSGVASREFTAAPSRPGVVPSNASSLVPTPASPQEMADQRDRYERGRKMHRTGNIMTVVGAAAFLPLSYGLLVTAFSDNGVLAAVFGIGVIGSVGSYYAGGILSSVGAFTSTNAVNAAFGLDIDTGVALGGIVSSSAGILLTPFIIGGFAPIVGVICGVVQFRKVKSALEDLGVAEFQLAPTPRGFAMSMRL